MQTPAGDRLRHLRGSRGVGKYLPLPLLAGASAVFMQYAVRMTRDEVDTYSKYGSTMYKLRLGATWKYLEHSIFMISGYIVIAIEL